MQIVQINHDDNKQFWAQEPVDKAEILEDPYEKPTNTH